MLYLAQVISYTGILWLLYMLLLRNRPMHTFNRMYLLAASVLPVIMPLLKLPQILQQKLAAKAPVNLSLPAMIVRDAPAIVPANNAAPEHALSWALIIYTGIAICGLLFVVYRRWQIQRLVWRSNKVIMDDHVLLKNTGYGPGSWGKYIFLPDAEADDMIIRHEVAHVQLHHTIDIMLLSVCQCLLWPNIFLYAIRKELRQVHEFQADARAAADADSYSQLLLSSVFDTCTLPFAHSFIIHPIKRRIMMLYKSNNIFINKLAGTVTTVLTAGILSTVLVLQSCSKERQLMDADTITDLSKAPGAPYGTEWNMYMNKHMTYPAKAKAQQLEGNTIVKFVVDKDGSIVDPQIVRSTDTLFSAAALDLIKGMPKWTPGEKNGRKVAVTMYQPFSFKLNNITNVSYSFGKVTDLKNVSGQYNMSKLKPETVTRNTSITMSDPSHNYDSAVSRAKVVSESLMDQIEEKTSGLNSESVRSLEAAAKRIQEAQDKIYAAQATIDKSQKEIEAENKKAQAIYEKEHPTATQLNSNHPQITYNKWIGTLGK